MIVRAKPKLDVEKEEILTLIPFHPARMKSVGRRRKRRRTKLVHGPSLKAEVPYPVMSKTVTRSLRGGVTLLPSHHPRQEGG